MVVVAEVTSGEAVSRLALAWPGLEEGSAVCEASLCLRLGRVDCTISDTQLCEVGVCTGGCI